MRQSLHEFDDGRDAFELVGEQRSDEDYRARDRRLPAIFLAVCAMALFAGGLWFAYDQGARRNAVGAQGDSVPLIRADPRPDKVKPDQPGGMPIPDQNVSLYNDKPGGNAVEKLLPAAEQPMPRPAAPPKEPPSAAASAPGGAEAAAVSTPPPAAGGKPGGQTRPTGQAKPPVPAKPPGQPKPAAAQSPAGAHAGKAGPVHVRLASVRSAEAARDEWSRLKRENPDLLGKLSAVAVRADLGEKGIYYRIQAGPLSDAAAAERLCSQLKRRKLGCLLAR
jgi:hypothetical protein